jgi:hypothetical protein
MHVRPLSISRLRGTAGRYPVDIFLRNHGSVGHDANNLLKSLVFVRSHLLGHFISQQISMRSLQADVECSELSCCPSVQDKLEPCYEFNYRRTDQSDGTDADSSFSGSEIL